MNMNIKNLIAPKLFLILFVAISGMFIFPKDASATECNLLTVCGKTCTFGDLTYGTVLAADGKCWLDRNLGATQVATAYNDSAAYGWIFQWGRSADGHQIPTSEKTSILSSTDDPGHSYFIKASPPPCGNCDWRDPQNDNLWQGINGINNPCPTGFRLPTMEEWVDLINSENITNYTAAFSSSLKLTAAGYRGPTSGTYEGQGNVGYYWSSSVRDTGAYDLQITSSQASTHYYQRTVGFSVRCIAENTNTSPINIVIDIKPRGERNIINLKGEKEVLVAILSKADFSAPSQADRTSLTFGKNGDEESLVKCEKKSKDFNKDGLLDLGCVFKVKATGLECGDTEAILEGKTLTGITIEGKQTIKVVPCRRVGR